MKTLAILAIACLGLAAAQDCDQSQLIPSARNFGAGWDSQKLTFLDLPLLSWTCNQGKKFSPPSHPEISWQVPDQLEFAPESAQQEQVVLTITKDYHEMMKQVSSQFSFNLAIPMKIGTLSFGYGREYQKLHEEMSEKDRYASFSFHWWKIMTGQAYPDFVQKLDPTFQQLVDMMPASPASIADWQPYLDAITYYGTHRAIQSSFGGLYHLYSFADQDLLQTHDESWLSQQFSLSFHLTAFNISPSFFLNTSQIVNEMDNNYVAKSSTDEFYTGGDPTLQSNLTIADWTKSIPAQPGPLNTTFVYIWKLIKDANKQANLKKAVAFYEQYACLPTDDAWTPCTPPASDVAPGFSGVHTDDSFLAKKKKLFNSHRLAEMKGTNPIKDNAVNIPGTEVLIAGVNGASMESLNLPLFDFSYTQGETWQNPNYQGPSYSVADQLYALNDPETFLLNESTLIHEVSDMVYYSNYHHSSSINWIIGHSSSSTTVIHFAETFYQRDEAMTLRSMRVSEYKLMAYPFAQLGRVATMILQHLPRTYDAATQDVYFQFLETMGTEWVSSATFGGSVYAYVYFHKCFLDVQSFDWISHQSEFSFLGLINKGDKAYYWNSLIDKHFRRGSSINVTLTGGDSTTPVDDLDTWVPTIANQYGVLDMEVRPIYELITDPVLQANIKQARADYLGQSNDKFNAMLAKLQAADPNTKPAYCDMGASSSD